MPSVKVNKKIYIPMCDTIITRENIHELPKFNNEYNGKHQKESNAWKK